MWIEFDDYEGWNFRADPLWKEYNKECENMGAVYRRDDEAAKQSAVKLEGLINQYLKWLLKKILVDSNVNSILLSYRIMKV